MKKNSSGFGRAAGALILLLGGCVNHAPPADPIAALTEAQIAEFYRRAADPRRFFLTAQQASEKDMPVFANANRQPDGRLALVPFDPAGRSALPLIRGFGAADREFTALLDTSSKENWIAFDAVAPLGVTPLGPRAYRLLPGQVRDDVAGYLCVMPLARVDDLRIEALTVFARAARGPLWPLTREASTAGAGMVWGMNLLRSFAYVHFDFPNRAVLFSSETPYPSRPELLVARLPMQNVEGCLAVGGTLDGVPATFILDTAGDYELALAEPPAGLVRQISLGDWVLRNVRPVAHREKALRREEVPHIGNRLLARYRLTLDNIAQAVYVETPEL